MAYISRSPYHTTVVVLTVGNAARGRGVRSQPRLPSIHRTSLESRLQNLQWVELFPHNGGIRMLPFTLRNTLPQASASGNDTQ
jgi:hypothetical protein